MIPCRWWFSICGCLGLFIATSVAGQQPTSVLSPSELLRRVEERGSTDNVLGQFLFRGCPESDPRGRDILDLLTEATLPPEALYAIGFTWRTALAECDYAPLDEWYDRALQQLIASKDTFSLMGFVNAVGQHATDSMRETLWGALEQTTDWDMGREGVMASVAVADSRPTEWVARGLEAIAHRRASEEWLDWQTYELLREHPTIFMRSLVRTIATFPDDRLLLVLGVIHRNIEAGTLGPQAPDLDALRWAVRSREGIPADSLIGPVN